jgi:hypothetical protein
MYRFWITGAAAALAWLVVAPGQTQASWLSELLHRALDQPNYAEGYYGYYTTPGYYVPQPMAPAYAYWPPVQAPYVPPSAYYSSGYYAPYTVYPPVPQYYGGWYAPRPDWHAWHEENEHLRHDWHEWNEHREHDHGHHH